jgi:hypothetical protein
VDQFTTKHQANITGTISCFDRILFKAHLPLGWADAMERFITRQGLRLKDFGAFVNRQSERTKQHAKDMATRLERPYIYLEGPIRKEDRVQALLRHNPVTEGLVCILAAVEACQSFKLAYGEGRPRIVPARRKCLCLYFYFIDRQFGLLHVRIATWFPFPVQVCLNGHDWLARQMDRHDIRYRRIDNAFLVIDDPARAQRMADRFVQRSWPRIFSALARRVNPLMNSLLRGMHYYWITQQAEYATDVMLQSPAALAGLYDRLLKHATTCFSAEDVMTFLGRKLNGHFAGEVGNDGRRRWPGARVRHRRRASAQRLCQPGHPPASVCAHPYSRGISPTGGPHLPAPQAASHAWTHRQDPAIPSVARDPYGPRAHDHGSHAPRPTLPPCSYRTSCLTTKNMRAKHNQVPS